MFEKSAQFFNGCGRNPNWANFISTTYFLDFIEICFRVLIKHPFSCLRRETAEYFYENFVPTLIALLLWLNPFFQNRIVPNKGKLILCHPKSVFMDWNQFFRFTLCGANLADTKWESEHNRRYFSFKIKR